MTLRQQEPVIRCVPDQPATRTGLLLDQTVTTKHLSGTWNMVYKERIQDARMEIPVNGNLTRDVGTCPVAVDQTLSRNVVACVVFE